MRVSLDPYMSYQMFSLINTVPYTPSKFKLFTLINANLYQPSSTNLKPEGVKVWDFQIRLLWFRIIQRKPGSATFNLNSHSKQYKYEMIQLGKEMSTLIYTAVQVTDHMFTCLDTLRIVHKIKRYNTCLGAGHWKRNTEVSFSQAWRELLQQQLSTPWPNMQHKVNGAQINNSSSAGARDFRWLQLINYSANT
jgi:hypothetical protein